MVDLITGLGVMLLLIPVNVIISMKQRKLQTDLMRYKDDRLKLMNEILNGMKVGSIMDKSANFYQEKSFFAFNKLEAIFGCARCVLDTPSCIYYKKGHIL